MLATSAVIGRKKSARRRQLCPSCRASESAFRHDYDSWCLRHSDEQELRFIERALLRHIRPCHSAVLRDGSREDWVAQWVGYGQYLLEETRTQHQLEYRQDRMHQRLELTTENQGCFSFKVGTFEGILWAGTRSLEFIAHQLHVVNNFRAGKDGPACNWSQFRGKQSASAITAAHPNHASSLQPVIVLIIQRGLSRHLHGVILKLALGSLWQREHERA